MTFWYYLFYLLYFHTHTYTHGIFLLRHSHPHIFNEMDKIKPKEKKKTKANVSRLFHSNETHQNEKYTKILLSEFVDIFLDPLNLLYLPYFHLWFN